jgi:predicted MFS family arabinose efflux permease
VYAIVGAADHGWSSASTLGLGGVALALLVGFVARQATAANPLLPLRLFRTRNLWAANVVQVLMIGGLFGMFFSGSLYLQRVRNFGPVEIGLAFLPVAIAIGTLSLGFSARLMNRYGARAVMVPGLVLIVVGLLLLVRVPVESSYVADLLPSMVLFGVGAGLAFPVLVTVAMSGATPSDSGVASGLVNTTQQVGGALGLAILATLATSRSNRLLAGGDDLPSALTSGYQLGFAVAAGAVVAAVIIAAVVLRPQAAVEHEPITFGSEQPQAADALSN